MGGPSGLSQPACLAIRLRRSGVYARPALLGGSKKARGEAAEDASGLSRACRERTEADVPLDGGPVRVSIATRKLRADIVGGAGRGAPGGVPGSSRSAERDAGGIRSAGEAYGASRRARAAAGG